MIRPKGGHSQPRNYYYKEDGEKKLVKFLEDKSKKRFYKENKKYKNIETIDDIINVIKKDLEILKKLREGR